MTNLGKVAGINILLVIIYTMLTNLISSGSEKGMQVAVMLMIVIILHVGALLLVSLYFFVRRTNVVGRNFLLSSLIVLVIGFSACLGSLSFY